MTREQIRETIFRVLGEIAPEVDLTQLKPDQSIREQMDLDSMDVLNFVVGLHKELQVEIPEADYSKLSNLNGCLGYLAARKSATY